MEHALRVSEETTRVLLNATDDILFLVDTNGLLLAINEALAKQTGKSVRDLTGTNVSELVSPGDFIHPHGRLECQCHPEKAGAGSRRNSKGPGTTPRCTRSSIPEGNVVLFAVYIRNITRIKNVEEQARNNEEFFRSLVEDTSDIIAILNRDGTIRHESPSINRALGYPAEDLVGKSLFTIVPEEEVPAAQNIFAGILESPGMVKPIRLMLKKKDGTTCVMEGIISNLNGNPVIDGIVLNGWIKNTDLTA